MPGFCKFFVEKPIMGIPSLAYVLVILPVLVISCKEKQ